MAVFLIIIIVLIVLAVIGVYNGLIKGRIHTQEAWADIDTQLKRRYDLIPNLVNTVKGYAQHEEKVFTEVTEARTAAMANQGNPAEQAKTENMLQSALKSLFAVAENYPELKANQNFQQLQMELADTENKIQASRRFYNGTVRDYNTKCETIPSSIIANMFGFKKKEFFEIEEEAQRENVEVKF